MRRVTLVGCAATKLQHPAPARDLYTSQLFRQASAWAQRNGDAWYILSALHGLLTPDATLAPYNMHLSQLDGRQRRGWALTIASDLLLIEGDVQLHITALAGRLYTDPLQEMGWKLELPLAGMSIGKRLQWFRRELVAAS